MKQGPKFLIGVIPVLLAAALIALAAGAASGNFGSTPLPPKSTPSSADAHTRASFNPGYCDRRGAR